MNIDGEGILLSEMRNAGMIQNCGFLSNLIKAVVKVVAVVAVVTVAAVACVYTAGAAAPALVAAGMAAKTATVVAFGAGTLFGAATYSLGMAAVKAGTAFTEKLADELEWVINKTSKNIIALLYKGKEYVTAALTATVIMRISKSSYFMAFADPKDGAMYYTPTPISRDFAISIMNYNTAVSVYTYYESSARSIAQVAGGHMSPIHDYAHKSGYFNHYHLGNISHDLCKAHAFYGFPVFF